MARTVSGKADRNRETERVSFSVRIRRAWRSVGTFFTSVFRSGKQRFTIMFIPHSEKRVLNFQLNSFALIFVFTLIVAVVTGFFFLATAFSGSERLAQESGARLQDAEASLEEVRYQIAEFLQVWDEFEDSLGSTLQRLDISDAGGGETPGVGGDLSSLLNLQEVRDGDMQEVLDLQRVVASLRGSMGPLEEITEVLDLHRELLSDIPNLWPVIGGRGIVTMEFGPNVHPIRGNWYMHKGVDIWATMGTPIVAAANGVVSATGTDNVSGYGVYVDIDHNYGFKTRYAHLQRSSVVEGEEVVQGQRIGTMGNTGLSTGTHLDFQIWIGTENIDPVHFLKLSKPDFNRRTRNGI